uniref:WD repeat and FYVE domain containing 1 n=1 Tax=Capra hircus TaxID=9925 RepID=A0A8C2NQC3_CAPHI
MAAEIHSRPQSSRPVLLSKIEGHQDAVTAALLIPKEDGVITASEDRTIRVWLKRDSGQYWPSIYHTMASPCSAMAYHHDSRRIFVGQDNGAVMHHCRKCGQAVCGKCSSKRSSYPVMGFEFQVRVCDSCYDSIKDEDRTSLATFHEGKHNISHMSMDVARGLMVTCGTDRVVKVSCLMVPVSTSVQTAPLTCCECIRQL